MDASAFEEDTGDVDASAVLQCMSEDLNLPLAGAVAIVVHIVRLAILVLALFACVVLHCFTLSWLVHLWLQTSLLTFAAALLRSCIGDEGAVKGSGLHKQRRVPLPSEKWLEEPEPEALLDAAETGSSGIEESVKVRMAEVADAEPKCHSRAHEKSAEHVPNASRSLTNDHGSKPIQQQEPSSSATVAQKLPDAANTSDTAPLCSEAGQKALARNQEKSMAKENAVLRKPIPASRPVLTEQEKKAAAQTSFIENMKAGTLDRAPQSSVDISRPLTTNDATITRSNPFNVTAEQLAEASSFMSTASRDYDSKGSTGRGAPRSARPHINSTQRFQSPKPVAQPQKPTPADVASVSTPSGFVPPHIRKSMQAKARRATSQDLLQVTSGGKPVGVGQTPEGTNGDIASGQGPSSAAEEADKMVAEVHGEIDGEGKEKLKAELISDIKESTISGPADRVNTNPETVPVFDEPSAEPEHEAVFSRMQPSYPERLSFYDNTPELVQPASCAMTATALKAFQTTSTKAVDDRIDNARSIIEGSEATKTSPRLSTIFSERPIREFVQELPLPTIAISRPSDDDLFAEDPRDNIVIANGEHPDTDSTQEQASMRSRDDVVRRAVKVIQEQADAKMTAEKEPSGIAPSSPYPPIEPRADGASTSNFNSDLIDLDLGGDAFTNSVSAEPFSATPLRLSIEAESLVPSVSSALESTGEESISHEPVPSTTPRWRSVDASDTIESPGLPAQNGSPLLSSTSSGIRSATPLRPPGLQHARLENLDAFDALLSNGLASQVANGKLPTRSNSTKSAQLADLEEFSRTFRVPFQGREDAAMAATTELEIIEDNGDQASLSTGGPVQGIEHDVPSNVTTNGSVGVLDGSKRQVKEQKKLARDNLRAAWLAREEARTRVVSTWSLEGMQELENATRSYNEARDALATLMPSGHLNEEDSKSFPAFSTSALTAPKVRPSGMKAIKSRRDPNESNTSSPHDEDSESSSEIESLKDNMMVARKLREDAIAFQRSPRPNTNIAYRTWKETADGKLKRANLYYNAKRKALAAAFPGGVLPSELEAQFPEIL